MFCYGVVLEIYLYDKVNYLVLKKKKKKVLRVNNIDLLCV